MSLSPIGKALSTIRKHRVRALLMGGQACILYGAAEFSRDVDFAVLADDVNLGRLQRALAELQAVPVYVPELSLQALQRGHACHFRAEILEAAGLRVDVMSVLRGCDPFDQLWSRRSVLTLPGVGRVNVLALEDLVQAKKTQRDKDWPMIRRLVEADYHARAARPPRRQVLFWLNEARSPEMLVDLARRYPAAAREASARRPLIAHAMQVDFEALAASLTAEEAAIRTADRTWWQPLREELASLRQQARSTRKRQP